MTQTGIIYPLIAMIALTYFIGFTLLHHRFKAVRQDGLNPGYFLLNRGAKPPEYLIKVTQHYDNLFELPVLFYLVVVLILILELSDIYYIILAWAYFLTRLLHAIVHTRYNHLAHRRRVFLSSTMVLLAIWVKLFVQLVTS